MKKLIWLVCLSMLLGLLAGCQAAPGETTKPTGMTDQGAAATAQPTDPVDIRPLPPENPGSSLIDYDPDRQIYIAGENVYVDYYIGVSGIKSFYLDIYSRQPLDPEEISVTFPVDLPFLVTVNQDDVVARKAEIVLNDGTGVSYGHLPYYVYLAYRGETFGEGEVTSAVDLYSGIYEVEDAEGNIVSAADVLAGVYELKDGEEIEPRYREFASLKEEDLPELYLYTVVVALHNITELQETVVLDKLDLTIGGEVYEAKLGCVRLLPQEAFPSEARMVSLRGLTSNAIQLYNDGIFKLMDVLKLEDVPEDMTITDLRIAEEATRILDIKVVMNSGGQYMEMQWDGVSPIYLYKGDSIYIDVIVKNKYAGKLLNYVVSHAIVEYTNSDNEQLCAVCTQVSGMDRSAYEYYAIIFDGLDMESYYRNYFYQCTSFQWINEYREK